MKFSSLQTFHKVEEENAAVPELPAGEKSPVEKAVSQSSIIRRKSTRGSSFAASEGTKEEKTEEVQKANIRHLDKVIFVLYLITIQSPSPFYTLVSSWLR